MASKSNRMRRVVVEYVEESRALLHAAAVERGHRGIPEMIRARLSSILRNQRRKNKRTPA